MRSSNETTGTVPPNVAELVMVAGLLTQEINRENGYPR